MRVMSISVSIKECIGVKETDVVDRSFFPFSYTRDLPISSIVDGQSPIVSFMDTHWVVGLVPSIHVDI